MTSAILDQASLQDACHCFEDGLEGALSTYAAARDVGGQGDYREEFSTSSKWW